MKKRLSLYAQRVISVAKQVRMQQIVTAFGSGAEYAQLIKPLGKRPLILSAQPGNCVMAMGGTMSWYAKLSVPMTVITFTAGKYGTNTGQKSEKLGPKRRKEQLAALKVIGGEVQPVFLDQDEGFAATEELVFSLLDTVDELNPDIIFCPSLLENHPDHQSISLLLGNTLRRLPSTRMRELWIAQYELWTPLIPNRLLNIDDFIDKKTQAIECHESQLLCRDYVTAVNGLNRYRAAILGAGSTAEAFYVCKAKQYGAFLSAK